MRAKFIVTSVTPDDTSHTGQRTYELSAVYDSDTEENQRFAQATPSGYMSIVVDNPDVRLQKGRAYYLDFTACNLDPMTGQNPGYGQDPARMGNTHDVPAGQRYEPQHTGRAGDLERESVGTLDASGNKVEPEQHSER